MEEKFNTFDKLNIIHQYFTQPNLIKNFVMIVTKNWMLPYISVALRKFFQPTYEKAGFVGFSDIEAVK